MEDNHNKQDELTVSHEDLTVHMQLSDSNSETIEVRQGDLLILDGTYKDRVHKGRNFERSFHGAGLLIPGLFKIIGITVEGEDQTVEITPVVKKSNGEIPDREPTITFITSPNLLKVINDEEERAAAFQRYVFKSLSRG